MKTLILAFVSLTASLVFAAEPSSHQVFETILKDSGIEGVTDITVQQYTKYHLHGLQGTGNNLLYTKDGVRYVCSHAFMHAKQISSEEYLVDASVAGCRGLQDAPDSVTVKLRNDYTKDGVSVFSKVFFDNNSKFRNLTPDEKAEWFSLLSE